MADVPGTLQSPERLRKHAIASLAPFFFDGPDRDSEAACLAATGMLDGYNAMTPKELQLSAQIIALSWSSMACLRAAMTAKNLPVAGILKLQDQAIALDRSAQKATKALEARRKERARKSKATTPENMRWDEGVFQLTINQALEKLMDANAKLAAYTASLSPGATSAEAAAPSAAARRTRK